MDQFQERTKKKKTLFINSCVRENSRTLELARCFIDGLSDEIREINLQEEKIKPLDVDTLRLRDTLVRDRCFDHTLLRYANEFSQADQIVIAAPYWDLSFPSLLKIYLEAVTVCGVTFRYGEDGIPKGLCRAKELVYITTAGGPVTCDFGYSYIRSLAATFFGIDQTSCFRAEGLDIDGADTDGIMQKARLEIEEAKAVYRQSISTVK